MIDFYSKIKDTGNIFFSAWSIVSALSLVLEATRGDTAKQIASALYLSQDKNHRDSFGEIHKQLNEIRKGIEIREANALWIQKSYEIKQEFVEIAKRYYESHVEQVSFPDDEPKINRWLEKMTNNKIKNLISGTNDLTRLVITNAIYFKGRWSIPFKKSKTRIENFRVSKNKTVNVHMMKVDSSFSYAETEIVQILRLGYVEERFSMFVFLPKNDDLKRLEDSLTIQNLTNWIVSTSYQPVKVQIPRFVLQVSYGLTNYLNQLGVSQAFGSDADFGNLSEEKISISDVIHKAFVEVNEEGTEASAATFMVIAGRRIEYVKKIFNADHPFIFVIQDKPTGLILFMGKFEYPIQDK